MNVFVSGPLMFRDVVKEVTGKTFISQSGLLNGYAQFRLKDEGQSAMIPLPDSVVDGVVYLDVDAAALAVIDKFQGPRFVRVEVTIEAEGGAWVEADAYCLKLTRKKVLSAEAWDEDDYRENYLQKVLKSCQK